MALAILVIDVGIDRRSERMQSTEMLTLSVGCTRDFIPFG